MKDLTGQRFGRLTVLGFDSRVDYGSYVAYYWKCKCDCGEIAYINSRSLTSGRTKSCGCLRREKCAANRSSESRKNKKYISYNGETHSLAEWSEISGIPKVTIVSRLSKGLAMDKVFFKGRMPRGSAKESLREKCKKVTIDGTEYTISEAAKKFGVSYQLIYERISRGITGEEIISKKRIDKRKAKDYNK